MDVKSKVIELGLNTENSVIIGSGVLSALNLRESKDIDVVVTEEKCKELCRQWKFYKGTKSRA